MEQLSEYNQAFRDALQFISKYVYMNKSAKTLQNDITDLCHWIEENPEVSRKDLIKKLAETLRKFAKPEGIRM